MKLPVRSGFQYAARDRRSSILCTILLLILPRLFVQAQVINDNVANRLPLLFNQPLTSSTVGCTVEWNCLNQRLTSSCIKYHNDQWFSLVVPENKTYFLNLSDQACRDIWGVQVLIFDGIPCEPATYQLLECHSEGNTDDIFIRLPQLEPGREYLVNVDGYLNDQCSFALELSDTPKGLPLQVYPDVRQSVQAEGRLVNLSWSLDEALAGTSIEFEVYRSRGDGQPFERLTTLSHQRNAFGEGKQDYLFQDTLEWTRAEYKVVAQTTNDRILLLHEFVQLDMQAIRTAPENTLDLELDYTAGDPIGVIVYDQEADSVLFTDEFNFEKDRHQNRRYYIGDYRQSGIHRFRVMVIQKKSWQRREFEFVKD